MEKGWKHVNLARRTFALMLDWASSSWQGQIVVAQDSFFEFVWHIPNQCCVAPNGLVQWANDIASGTSAGDHTRLDLTPI